MDILVTAVLATALVAASVTDIRNQRIYNWLTFPLILSGLATHTVFGGFAGLKFAASGFALGFAAMAIPYFLGVMGAGDVKLMAGVGAWLGLDATLTAFLCTCMAGGVYALGVLAFDRKTMMAVLRNIANVFLVFIATRSFNFAPTSTEKALPRLCYGLAIAAGTFTAMGLYAWRTGSIHIGY
ncbi:Type IV leader peptidase family protein [Pseudodesulfovibrio hydrargyri]|uniref:Type IV leader peptidase family protein n=1 Tax=Pseudodesulfovibrio hydrargyri TaxID=2125990 RepID=A0A1J5N4Z7_9BACT|nr:A24 family peptidase [Pseudodesulfovibrio hydrargyri]OIQ50675.1 Type IV leader peptidase family protein [Pseudodesulfovibrio hydrargyri]